jgi:hypothetical protein
MATDQLLNFVSLMVTAKGKPSMFISKQTNWAAPDAVQVQKVPWTTDTQILMWLLLHLFFKVRKEIITNVWPIILIGNYTSNSTIIIIIIIIMTNEKIHVCVCVCILFMA